MTRHISSIAGGDEYKILPLAEELLKIIIVKEKVSFLWKFNFWKIYHAPDNLDSANCSWWKK